MGHHLIILATENNHKLEEFRALWTFSMPLVSLTDIHFKEQFPDENYSTYEGNARQKAEFVGRTLKAIVLADDSGFEVSALDGKPGVQSARFAGTRDSAIQRTEILKLMKDKFDRSARFVCCLALYSPKNDTTYTQFGYMNGQVALQEAGDEGFGYDPIFIPEGFNQTVAELPASLKNSISHRSQALKSLQNSFDLQAIL